MEVQIVERRANIVRVHTAIGDFDGIWCSSTPVILKNYIVELDSDDVLTSEAIELSNSCEPYIEHMKSININGLVEEIQGGVMVLRLQNTLMMLEIVSDAVFLHYIGRYVRVRLDKIKLYDTGIL